MSFQQQQINSFNNNSFNTIHLFTNIDEEGRQIIK